MLNERNSQAARQRNSLAARAATAAALLFASLFAVPPPAAAPAQESGALAEGQVYTYRGSIPLSFSPTHLDIAPNGRLFVVSRNFSQDAASVSAYAVLNPTSDFTPVAFDTETFARGYGYAGVATDPHGNVYLTGDTGNPETCFIKKFDSSLRLDGAFGIAGTRRNFPLRALGCDYHAAGEGRGAREWLLVAFSWGYIHVFDARTGQYQSLVPGNNLFRVRDISIEPSQEQIFGVGQGAVYWWSQGTVARPDDYVFQALGSPVSDGSAVEGVAFHRYLAGVFYGSANPPQVRMLQSTGETTQMSQLDNPNLASVSDIAFTPDHQVMFASDPARQALHYSVYVAAENPPLPAGGLVGRSLRTSASTVEVPEFRFRMTQRDWYETLPKLSLDALQQNKMMGIYFRNDVSDMCRQLESGLFAGQPLFDAFPSVLWMKLDIDNHRDLAQSFGVFRVPAVVLFNQRGDRIAVLSGGDVGEQSIRQTVEQYRPR